jgi:hypothetical protein
LRGGSGFYLLQGGSGFYLLQGKNGEAVGYATRAATGIALRPSLDDGRGDCVGSDEGVRLKRVVVDLIALAGLIDIHSPLGLPVAVMVMSLWRGRGCV